MRGALPSKAQSAPAARKLIAPFAAFLAFAAALDVAADEHVPDEFALSVIPDGDPRRCAVVWRKEKRIAVVFYW